MATSFFYIYAMATSFFYIYVNDYSFFYIYVLANSFFYIHVMATSFFYIYIYIYRDIYITFTNWRCAQSFFRTQFLISLQWWLRKYDIFDQVILDIVLHGGLFLDDFLHVSPVDLFFLSLSF